MYKKQKENFMHDMQLSAYSFYTSVFGDDKGFNDWFYTWGLHTAIVQAEEDLFEARRSFEYQEKNRWKFVED